MSTPSFNTTDMISMLNQLKAYGIDGNSSNSAFSGTNFINSVYSLMQDGQNFADGNGAQKAQIMQSMMQKVLSLVSSFGNEQAKAQQEVKREDAKINGLEAKADNVYQTVETKINEICNNVGNSTLAIKNAIDTIEKLGGNKGQIAEKQEELAGLIKIVEEQKLKFDEAKDAKGRKEALSALLDASSKINGLLVSISEIQAQIVEQNNIVVEQSEIIAEDMTEATNQMAQGIGTVQETMQQEGLEVANVTATNVEGVADETVGASLEATGTATSLIGGSSLAIKGQKLITAGGTRISGSASNLGNITKAIGSMTDKMSNFTSTMNELGKIGQEYAGLVGQYGSTLEPMITSLGSWVQVAEANTVLEQTIEQYAEELDMHVDYNQNENKLELVENDNQEHAQDDNLKKIKFNFDVSSFEIELK